MSLVSLIGLPLSIVSKTDKNLEFFCIILAKAYKYFDRSNGANLDHFGNAFFAAFTARSTSFFDETDNLPIFFSVSYTHLRAHETHENLVCRLLLEKIFFFNDTATTEIYTTGVVGSVRCV